MRTVQPSIMIGAYGWDQDRLPRDEFEIRVRNLRAVMDQQGWRAVLIYGDADQHAALGYFSNFIPRLRWGMALIPRDGEPRLLVSMSSRDVPAMKLMTWIADVHTGWTWESAFDPWLARLPGPEPADIGTVGFDLMRPVLMRSVETSLGNRFRLAAGDAAVAAARGTRPREVAQLREAARVAQAAGAAIRAAWQDGADPERAALAGERQARMQAAQDVRTLMSFDGGRTLSPGRGDFAATAGGLVAYIAVKHAGYWADMFVGAPPRSAAPAPASDVRRRVADALAAVVGATKAGVAARSLHAAAVGALGNLPLHPALGGGVGHRIGLALEDGADLTAEATHTLQDGDVYTLHVGTYDPDHGGAFASAMIRVTGSGSERLLQSDGGSSDALSSTPRAPA